MSVGFRRRRFVSFCSFSSASNLAMVRRSMSSKRVSPLFDLNMFRPDIATLKTATAYATVHAAIRHGSGI